jgi:hypothetical protein
MGLFSNEQPQHRFAAMPIITDEYAAAILVGAKHNKLREQSPTNIMELFSRGLLFGDAEAKEAFYDLVQIDLGDELILVCDCCDSVYQYFESTKSLTLFEGSGC